MVENSLKDWCQRVRAENSQYKTRISEPDGVVVTADKKTNVSFVAPASPAEGQRITFRTVGASDARIVVNHSDIPLAILRLDVDTDCELITLDGDTPVGLLELNRTENGPNAPSDATRVGVGAEWSSDTVELTGGPFDIQGFNIDNCRHVRTSRDETVISGDGPDKNVGLEIRGILKLVGGGECNLGMVRATSDGAITGKQRRFDVEADMSESPSLVLSGQRTLLEGISDRAEFSLENAELFIHGGVHLSLTVQGKGELQVLDAARIDGATIGADKQSVLLTVAGNSSLQGIKGVVKIGLVDGIINGDPENGLTLRGVREVRRDAELAYINIYSLRLPDVIALTDAEMVAPWFPSGLRKRARAENSMNVGVYFGVREDQKRRRRVDFWVHLHREIVKKSGGTAETTVAVAAYRSRRRAAPRWSAERLVLSLFALFGYGQRLWTPLLPWTVFALLAALFGPFWDEAGRLVPDGISWLDYSKSFGLMILAPLQILRVFDFTKAACQTGSIQCLTLSSWWWVAAVPFGAICIGFMLNAARRLARS